MDSVLDSWSLLDGEEKVEVILTMVNQLVKFTDVKKIKNKSEKCIKKLEKKGEVKPSKQQRWIAAGLLPATGQSTSANYVPPPPSVQELEPEPEPEPEPSPQVKQVEDWGDWGEPRPVTDMTEWMAKRQEIIRRHAAKSGPSSFGGFIDWNYELPPNDLPFVTLDCEFVTLNRMRPEGGYENVAAEVSIVAFNGNILMDRLKVKHLPGTFRSGLIKNKKGRVITNYGANYFVNGLELPKVKQRVLQVITGHRVLVWGNERVDFDSLGITEDEFPSVQVFNLQNLFRKQTSEEPVSLKVAVELMMSQTIQAAAHNCTEDAIFALLLYKEHVLANEDYVSFPTKYFDKYGN